MFCYYIVFFIIHFNFHKNDLALKIPLLRGGQLRRTGWSAFVFLKTTFKSPEMKKPSSGDGAGGARGEGGKNSD
jgi:hypothetical protein